MIILLPLLVALIGGLMYGLSSNGKVAELGRLLFFAGAFVATFRAADMMVRVIGVG